MLASLTQLRCSAKGRPTKATSVAATRSQRHVPAFDFARPFPALPLLPARARSHTFQSKRASAEAAEKESEGALTFSPQNRPPSPSRPASQSCPSCPSLPLSAFAYSFSSSSAALQNHRPIFSSLSFSLSTRSSRSSPPLPSSSARSLRWMTLSLRGRERGKILNSERFRAIEPILLIGRRRWWWWHERAGSLALQIAHGLQPAGASWQNIIHLSEHHCAASSEQFGTGQNIESTSDRRVSPLQPERGRHWHR